MRLTLITCCILLLFCACSKEDSQPDTTTTTYTNIAEAIVVSGCGYTNESISFSVKIRNSVPASSVTSTVWSFGDGSAAYTQQTYHTYSTAGTYIVSAIVNGELLTDTIKIISAPTSAHTSAMGGNRQWTGTAGGYVMELDIVFPGGTQMDTEFAVTVVDERTITVPFKYRIHTLKLYSVDSIAKTLIFTPDCIDREATLTYFYLADSIVYSHHSSEGKLAGGMTIHTH